jgi:competence protein ComEC
MGSAPTMPPPGGGRSVPADGAFASAWARFRGWPFMVQLVVWLPLWPVLLALLVMSGHTRGRVRPVAAAVVLAVTGPIWVLALTSGSDPLPIDIEDAATEVAADEQDGSKREREPETRAEPEPDPRDDADPEPATDDEEPDAGPDPEGSTETDDDDAGASAVAGELEVHYLNVGQGDATLLTHADATILIDTGRHQASDVVTYLRSLGVDSLDLVVITHPHADHIGQFDQVIDAVPVDEVWWSGSTTTSQTFERAVAALDRSDAVYEEPRAGDVTTVGPLRIEVVNPPVGVSLSDVHDAGLAFRVTYGDVRFLFTGDAEAATESRMTSRSSNGLSADILQLGHHGSRTSTTAGFLAAVDPSVAIYSASSGNQYGHPHAEVLDRLDAAGIEVYGTAVHGTVTVVTDGRDWTVDTGRVGTPTPGGSPRSAAGSSEPGSAADEEASSAPAAAADDRGGACAPGQVDINAAGFEDLQLIIHIGPDRAGQIPGLRPFSSVGSMDRISGIGPARLADITSQGVACVG